MCVRGNSNNVTLWVVCTPPSPVVVWCRPCASRPLSYCSQPELKSRVDFERCDGCGSGKESGEMLISFEPFCSRSHPSALSSAPPSLRLSPVCQSLLWLRVPSVAHFFPHHVARRLLAPNLLPKKNQRTSTYSPIPLFAMRRNEMKQPED